MRSWTKVLEVKSDLQKLAGFKNIEIFHKKETRDICSLFSTLKRAVWPRNSSSQCPLTWRFPAAFSRISQHSSEDEAALSFVMRISCQNAISRFVKPKNKPLQKATRLFLQRFERHLQRRLISFMTGTLSCSSTKQTVNQWGGEINNN